MILKQGAQVSVVELVGVSKGFLCKLKIRGLPVTHHSIKSIVRYTLKAITLNCGKCGLEGCTYFFLFCLKNIDCGYSLELPSKGGFDAHKQSMFCNKYKESTITYHLINVISRFMNYNFLSHKTGPYSIT